MATNKKGFVLYADQRGIFDKLPNEKAGELIKHILKYVNDEDPKTEDLLIEIAFESIKQQLKRDLQNWENIKQVRSDAGKKGMKSRWDKVTNNKHNKNNKAKQKLTNITVKGNVTVNDNVKVKDIILSKDNTVKTEYGNPEINNILKGLKKTVDIPDFSESQKYQRMYGKHFVNLLAKIGKDEFRGRIELILSDSFKFKNCNSLKYLYNQMKSTTSDRTKSTIEEKAVIDKIKWEMKNMKPKTK